MSSSTPDFRALPRHDQVALGVGVLVFLASFLPWYGETGFGVTSSFTAWHEGVSAFGLILLFLATALTVAELFAHDVLPELPVSYQAVEAVVAGIGAIFVVIRSLDLPSGDVIGVAVGLRWGGWILILVTVAQAGISALRAVHANDGVAGVPPV